MPNDDPTKTPTLESTLSPITDQAGDEAPETPSVPDAYRDKSLEDVIAIAEQRQTSYNELRALQSRQANELGEVRGIADKLIKADLGKRTTGPDTADAKVEIDLDDPDKATNAIQQLIDAKVEAALAQVDTKFQSVTAGTFESRMDAAHPEWRQTSSTQEFLDWVSSSPVRLGAYKTAAAESNFAYADDLLSSYQATKATPGGDSADPTPSTGDKLKAATLETGGSKQSTHGKDIYRRSDILHLRMTNPTRYAALRDDIDKAYAEGRVK